MRIKVGKTYITRGYSVNVPPVRVRIIASIQDLDPTNPLVGVRLDPFLYDESLLFYPENGIYGAGLPHLDLVKELK